MNRSKKTQPGMAAPRPSIFCQDSGTRIRACVGHVRARGSKGQSLVETALILVAFMSLLLAMTAVGEKLYVKQELAQRAHDAARWGALNPYDAGTIRNLVLYGTPAPAAGADAFDSLKLADVVVANPGCPGPDCRIRVAIPAHGVQSVQPVERTD
jgi:hypothetical protein